jgi:hypothetical protein
MAFQDIVLRLSLVEGVRVHQEDTLLAEKPSIEL